MARILALVLSIFVAGCSAPDSDESQKLNAQPDVSAAVEESAHPANSSVEAESAEEPGDKPEEVNVAAAIQEPRKELDLSLPDDFYMDDAADADKPVDQGFDAAELFDRTEKDTVKVIVVPSIEKSEEEDRLLEIDGMTVTIETKTP